MTVLYKNIVYSYTYIILKMYCILKFNEINFFVKRRFSYGKSLIPILKSLVLWGKDYAKAIKFNNFKMDFPEN